VPDEPTARKLADARNELANQARDAKLRAASSSGFDKFMANLGGEGIKEERTFPIVLKARKPTFAAPSPSTPSSRRRRASFPRIMALGGFLCDFE